MAEQIQLAAQQSVASLGGEVAETLIRDLVAQVRHSQQTEAQMRHCLLQAFDALPPSPHLQLLTIPGIGPSTAAVLTAKIVDINRFGTAPRLVNYFGVFPEENSSGVDKHGHPLPPGTLFMSRKGNDLARYYLWNAARVAIRYNPAVRPLYRRLKAKGTRGDVALGHCMTKLVHLAFAVWKTNRPFDPQHYPWDPSENAPSTTTGPVSAKPTTAATPNNKAVGHKRDVPATEVVTTAKSTVTPPPVPVKPVPAPRAPRPARPRVDYAFLRQQVTMEQVLGQLSWLGHLRGRGHQRRGPCPIHSQPEDRQKTFSVHLGQNLFQCFQAECGTQGNVLDLWAAVHHLPLYEVALHLAETFHLRQNREEKL